MQADFARYTYGTDSGPACAHCGGELWIYRNSDCSLGDERAWRFDGQCACCHRTVEFGVPFGGPRTGIALGSRGEDPTIAEVKAAHFASVAR